MTEARPEHEEGAALEPSTSAPDLASTPPRFTNSFNNLFLPKNRSTGNLISTALAAAAAAAAGGGRGGSETRPPEERHKIRFSLDAGQLLHQHDLPTLGMSAAAARGSILPEHEHGLGASGLHRIRQQPPSRTPTLPPSPELSSTNLSRAASMTIALPSSRSFLMNGGAGGGPTSPSFNFSEDLTRFPSESLHSFSFAHQPEDALHSRQNVMKRSIEFMRDRPGWAGTNPGLLTAQAKASGDLEYQSMLELLVRARVLGSESESKVQQQFYSAPFTGPALGEGNVFERTLAVQRSESPDGIDPRAGAEQDGDISRPLSMSSQSKDSVDASASAPDAQSSQSSVDGGTLAAPKPGRLKVARAELKRTYTDTSSLSLQTKLMDALAKPYLAKDPVTEGTFSPGFAPSLGKSLKPSQPMQATVHGHANRWAPAAQAIFTTETSAPWTILAANDLACLVFGVTRAEVKKLSMLEVVKEDRRKWLEDKLRSPGSEAIAKSRSPTGKLGKTSPRGSTTLAFGSGITAKLLSKPPVRRATPAASASMSRSPGRSQTDDGSGSSFYKQTAKPNHPSTKSRGVLLCGDVVPIQKRNGMDGSASLWVKEKRGGLIWVLEEISEDTALLQMGEEGYSVQSVVSGQSIWPDQTVEGKDIRRLVPQIPCTGRAVDYSTIHKQQYYALRNTDGYNMPGTILSIPSSLQLRVSSFPHIAGIMVLSAETLEITSSNSVFSAALFGQTHPDGLKITELIPKFDQILDLVRDEDNVTLVDGIVIPEHNFRRARMLLALREGYTDAAEIFSRPAGLSARHRDGSEINVDVQMRVVNSETSIPVADELVIEELDDEDAVEELAATSQVVYALWITYSRHLHSAIRPVGLASPLSSQPGSPPRQPSPGQSHIINPHLIDTDSDKADDSPSKPMSPTTEVLSKRIEEAASAPLPSVSEPFTSTTSTSVEKSETAASPPIVKPTILEPPRRKTINDFVILEDMGQGAYGQVKLARYKKNPTKKVVLKYVTKKRILVDTWTRDRRLGTVPLEIHVLDYLRRDGLKHPNIVEMTDFFEDDINYYIEMVPHGLPGMDLFDYIEIRSNMEEAECRNIFLQVVAALHHLHTKALVVHRDIKDENIILDGENMVKLIDFGSAAYIKNGPFDVFVGTIDYAAPEVLQGKSYRGKEQDVWALGILLYTLVYKENPFYSVDEILDHELRVPWVMSEGSIDLIRAMLNRDVETRLTITQVRDHPWCSGGGAAAATGATSAGAAAAADGAVVGSNGMGSGSENGNGVIASGTIGAEADAGLKEDR
ncbi:hypothetical protein MMC25_000967 [Agyrium rufum]|nr:hypothetical protein [Agyrium rufum]